MGQPVELKHGSVVIATIMSGNTRTSPSDMVGAALVAKKAYDIGLKVSLSFFYLVLSPGLGYNSCFFLFRLNNNSCFDIAIQVKPGVRTSVSPGYGIFNEYLLQRSVRKHQISIRTIYIGFIISCFYISLQWVARVLGQTRIPNGRPRLHNDHLGIWRPRWVNSICYFRKW